ncbi:MAG: Unknown protein [uncultured Campylobacterales bacterium]|uniref:Uncharacterized protein n=1 Tax=uncultured Campylobacterales bacterium TaxID=352960 RepID=A0A6S6SRS1_9BACT|nr:MAG: Unknown protein [uncultured Campylobacterales bacterium]
MTFKDNLKKIVKSIYREITLKNKTQIEFRAKLLTMMIISNKDFSSCEKDILKNITSKTYKNDKRSKMLQDMVEEYIELRLKNDINLDTLIFEIDRMIAFNPKLIFKIDIENLKLFLKCSCKENDAQTKNQILDYLKSQMREYTVKLIQTSN